jgi:L-serine dehydratase
MHSIKRIYKIGYGPSSSHTMGPTIFAKYILKKYENANYFIVTVYNSLALAGDGHLTITRLQTILKNCKIIKKIDETFHPLHLSIQVYNDKTFLGEETADSIGGGEILINNSKMYKFKSLYKESLLSSIIKSCHEKNISLIDYIIKNDEPDLFEYLDLVFSKMVNSIENGISSTYTIPGKLKLTSKAQFVNQEALKRLDPELLIASFAYAVSEANSNGYEIVTAPTCGSCGILPSLLYYEYKYNNKPLKEILNALAIAGLIGNIVATNCTLSGAIGGCQVEIGTASSMAAGALTYLYGGDMDKIEYASEIAIEHHLGLTCDPVGGYVQIPCIERNVISALKTRSIVKVSLILPSKHEISFDTAVKSMYQTGIDLNPKYKETALGGLAYYYKK